MTTQEIAAGAPSHESVNWHSIDWARCHREVRRLQARIVKATREGKHGKVKALQWILTHSFSGKALAVRRVTENQGKKTPGVDGITWSTPEAKSQAMLSIKRRGYRPQPLKRVYIPKTNGKMRPLGIPTMKDRAMQALYLLVSNPWPRPQRTDARLGSDPKGLRRTPSNSFTTLSKKVAPQWILEGDIKGCFDNISHDWLMGHVPTDREILRKWLKAGYMEDRQLFPTEAGTPQASSRQPWRISSSTDWKPTGCRVRKKAVRQRCTDPFDGQLCAVCGRLHCDGRSKELLEQEVMPIIKDFMQERGSRSHPRRPRSRTSTTASTSSDKTCASTTASC